MAGQPAIFLSPDDRPERLQWAAAHELGEMFACEAFHRAGVEADTSESGLREQAANLFASHLLLPSRSFFDEVRSVAGDLLELKAIFATASHELIAMRLLDLPEPSIVTIFDQGKVTRRRSSTTSHAPQLQQAERECWTDIHHYNHPSERSTDDFTVQGWPVHEPGWKREILRTVAHVSDW
jgi:Zn-dependent peptidase ImmA (M78 family)